MKISTLGSLTINSPLSSPRGQAPLRNGEWMSPTSITSSQAPLRNGEWMSPTSITSSQSPLRNGEWMSPTSITSSPISSNQLSPGKRVLRASASFNGRTISASGTTEEKRDIAFRRKKDHYALLSVPCHASYSDIRVAYRKLALKYHPDVMPLGQLETATELFSEINEAYDTLYDPVKRKSYDNLDLIPNFDIARAVATPSSSFGHRRGKNWETDQCWC